MSTAETDNDLCAEPGTRDDDCAADLCEGEAIHPNAQVAVAQVTIHKAMSAWEPNPVKLAMYTNGLLLLGVLVSAIFHVEVGYVLYQIMEGAYTDQEIMRATWKLVLWSAVHQMPIVLHGGGTITLRGISKEFNEVDKWRTRPWLWGTEICGFSALISILLLLWATHTPGALFVGVVIVADLFCEVLIWAGVRYVKDYHGALALMFKFAGVIPNVASKLIVRK